MSRRPAVFLSCALALWGPATIASAQSRQGPYSLELLGEDGTPLPTYQSRGRTYVLGAQGTRYALRVRNGSGQRIEAVAAVDGRDVLDGKPSALHKPGYLVAPYGEVVIDGFRLDASLVAAFRFSSVREAYASKMGDARDVGVIGVGVFTERYVPAPSVVRPVAPQPWWGRQPESSGKSRGDGAGRASDCPTCGSAAGAGGDGAAAAAPAAPLAKGESAMGKKAWSRPGLGTEFGEQRPSPVTEVSFVRASLAPAATLALRYDDREGLRAQGVELGGCGGRECEAALRQSASAFRRDREFSEPPPGWSGR